MTSPPFWFDDYSVLTKDWTSIVPTNEMSLVGKLNAVMRLGIALGVILFVATSNVSYIYIPFIVGVFTLVIYKTQYKTAVEYFSFYNQTDQPGCSRVRAYTLPNDNNPFMNANLITDPRDRPPAMPSYCSPDVKAEIEHDFNDRLFRDVGDLYSKNNSQRQFMTMPSTTIPNNQTAFAKFLYNTDATCKENTTKCAPYSDLLAK